MRGVIQLGANFANARQGMQNYSFGIHVFNCCSAQYVITPLNSFLYDQFIDFRFYILSLQSCPINYVSPSKPLLKIIGNRKIIAPLSKLIKNIICNLEWLGSDKTKSVSLVDPR